MEQTQPQSAFGQHFTMDCYGCLGERLSDLDLIYRFLDTCPDLIGMTKIMPPYVFKYAGKVSEDWGLSGFVLIAESHISLHTFPDKQYLSLDVFSCKPFDHMVAADYAKDLFAVGKSEVQVFDRGLEFPKDSQAVPDFLVRDREARK